MRDYDAPVRCERGHRVDGSIVQQHRSVVGYSWTTCYAKIDKKCLHFSTDIAPTIVTFQDWQFYFQLALHYSKPFLEQYKYLWLFQERVELEIVWKIINKSYKSYEVASSPSALSGMEQISLWTTCKALVEFFIFSGIEARVRFSKMFSSQLCTDLIESGLIPHTAWFYSHIFDCAYIHATAKSLMSEVQVGNESRALFQMVCCCVQTVVHSM